MPLLDEQMGGQGEWGGTAHLVVSQFQITIAPQLQFMIPDAILQGPAEVPIGVIRQVNRCR